MPSPERTLAGLDVVLKWGGGARWHPDTQTEGVTVSESQASRMDPSPRSAAGAHYQ